MFSRFFSFLFFVFSEMQTRQPCSLNFCNSVLSNLLVTVWFLLFFFLFIIVHYLTDNKTCELVWTSTCVGRSLGLLAKSHLVFIYLKEKFAFLKKLNNLA